VALVFVFVVILAFSWFFHSLNLSLLIRSHSMEMMQKNDDTAVYFERSVEYS
jgi:hypothetical protein